MRGLEGAQGRGKNQLKTFAWQGIVVVVRPLCLQDQIINNTLLIRKDSHMILRECTFLHTKLGYLLLTAKGQILIASVSTL